MVSHRVSDLRFALCSLSQLLQQAPDIVEMYALNVPPSLIRARIREQFERNQHVQDPTVMDVLLLKGRQELQETLNVWKQVKQDYFDPSFVLIFLHTQEPHILGMLLAEKRRPQQTFMQKFLEGWVFNPLIIPSSRAYILSCICRTG